MNTEEESKWARLVKRYPERAGVAYEIYLRHEKKNANLMTYFMWAAKRERQTEKRYREGLKKYCEKQKVKMEIKKDD